MGRVDGKVALVTGGASGIGQATARLLAREGARLAISDVQGDQARQTALEIEQGGGTVIHLHQDVTDEAAWPDIIAKVQAELGPLDVLVNNAGVPGEGATLEQTSLETWRRIQAVNLDGVFLGVKYGILAMKQRGGSIVNISSILGIVGLPQASAYAASKGGVKLLTKSAALECAALGYPIRVNSVHPGFIDTPMVAGAIQRRGPEMRQRIEAMQPTGEMGRAGDIAEGILYLASDASRFCTGSQLVIDGGFLAR